MKHACVSCCALQRELLKLQELSEQRAKQDHDQCVAMFQQMQELVRLNEAFNRKRPERYDLDDNVSTCSSNNTSEEAVVETASDSEQPHTRRLQMIIVQQAKELEDLRRRLQDAAADGRVVNQLEDQCGQEDFDALRMRAMKSNGTLDHLRRRLQDAAADGRVVNQLENQCGQEDFDALRVDSRGDESDEEQRDARPEKYASQLCKLPLTSLHAQLKRKDLQLLRLERIIAKLETRFGQLLDRKRSMAKSYQQTARTQQAHLKKYLAYIRQQKEEKTALERQLRELKQYVDVLEKKVVRSAR
ncbi:hypothetical protein PHMEG_0005072 [Phytophthora megakarya]|uniref:Uncharacterized protein n=1 Tax=Phytophthora megakarya TaxID=4795 RepID=A0A225WSB4_9STRA|nr:hypothetical protein PHMEG_0005072 [Phytophthora megakarya]